MAILKNLLVSGGASRFLGTSYFQDISIAGTASLASLSLSGNLSVTGNTTLGGTLGVTGAATFGNITATGTVVFSKTQDLSGTANSSPALIVGGTATSAHMELDADEIHAKATGTTVADLYLNNQGGKVYLSGNSVYASGSTFIAPTVAINNATISGDLTVNGVLHSNEFIKNIVKAVGGQLYVSPTFQATSSTTISCVSADTSYVYLTLQDNGITSSEYAGATWYSGSRIMLSGTLTANTTGHTEEILFSSAPGELTAQMNGGTNGAKKLQIKVEYDNASTYFKAGNLTFSDVAVMMYQLKNGSNYFPIGIYIKAYGTDNQKSYIDIFGGSATTPNARLGLLTGLGSMPSGSTIQGWGIYTDNGFFKGIIEANGGLIGNWTIGESSMYYSSDTPSDSSIVLAPGGKTASVNIGGSGTAQKSWVFTVKNLFGVDTSGALYSSSGKIAGWTIGTSSLYNTTNSMTSTGVGLYLGTDGIRNYASGTQYVNITGGKITALGADIRGVITATSGTIGGVTANSSYGLYTNSKTSATSTNTGFLISKDGAIYLGAYNSTNKACPFQVTSAGVLTATGATINGTLTAGANSQIGPWRVTTTSIYKTNATMGASTSGAAYFGNDGLSVTDKFKVTSAGALTATGVDVSGKITANTGYIGGTSGWTIASQQLSNGTLGADNSLYLGTKNLGSNTSIAGRQGSDWRLAVGSHFGVTNTGALYATSGKIGGFTIGDTTLKNGDLGGTTSVVMSTGTASSTAIGGSSGSKTWAFTASNKFGVTTSGELFATSGKIGGWTIGTSSLYNTTNSMTSTGVGLYLGTDGIRNYASGTQYVNITGGKITAFGVDIQGEITATSGSLAAGVIIGDANGYHAIMDSNSFDVFNGSNQLATFGQDTTIGDMSTRGVSIDENGFKFNNDGSQAFHIGIDSRTTDSIASSNGTTITNQVSKITVNNVVYYQLCAIDSTTDIVNVTSQGAINLDDPDYIKTGIWLTDGGTINLTWVIDSGYLWVHSPDYEKYTNFRDTVYYEYLVSTTTNSSPYCVIGASAYTEYEVAGFMSLSQGYLNKATGAFSTALGNGTEAQGSCSFACGKGSSANGEQSIAMMNSEVWGSYSIGIGRENAIYSHRSCSIGYENCIETIDTATATNNYAFGMRNDIGYITQYPKLSATHDASNCFAIGVANTVGGEGGIYTTMAIGFNNIAMEDSFAIGSRLVSSSGLVVGKYNQYTSQYSATDKITYYDSGNYAFVIGNGTSDGARSNALTVDWNGAVKVNGTLNVNDTEVNGTLKVNDTIEVDSTITIGDPANTFVITSHVVVNNASVASLNYKDGQLTINNAGYYPLCVAGYNSSTRYLTPTRFYLSNQQSGSGQLNYMIFNPTSSARTGTCTMWVMWVKTT